MSAKDKWTPYGLEAIRVSYLRRRRILSILIAVGLAGLWGLMFETTTTTGTDIFVNGQRQGTIEIDVPQEEQKKDGPVSVAISPGRVTRADTGSAPETTPTGPRASAPVFERDAPIPFTAFLILYGPYFLLAAALWFLAKKRGKHDQVNYGIYKGAMPLEMVSASMASSIFTTRLAKSGLFGKRRADHLPEEILRVERVEQEEAQS